MRGVARGKQLRLNALAATVTAIVCLATAASPQSLSTYTRTQGPEARIEVNAGERAAFRVPRAIYGTFLEDIGHSVFGGVSAELLDNPSLETYHAALRVLRERFPSRDFDHHRLEADQGFSFPVHTDKREHPVLDLVPLAGPRRIVTHHTFNPVSSLKHCR